MSRPGKPEISLKQIFFFSFSSVFCLFIKFKIYIVIIAFINYYQNIII
jgi:hypothetical protein